VGRDLHAISCTMQHDRGPAGAPAIAIAANITSASRKLLMSPAPDGNSPSGASGGPLMMGVGSWDALVDSGKAADAFSCPAGH
jgi:hypothetical protein